MVEFEKGNTTMASKKTVLGASLLIGGAALIAPVAMAASASASTAAVQQVSANSPGAGDLLGGLLGGLLGVVPATGPASAGLGAGITTSPSAPGETDDGDVSFTVQGSALPPGMLLTLSSVDLTSACVGGNTLDGMKVGSDFNGNFTTQVSGKACVPGTYTVDASEASSPYTTFTTTVTIAAP
jgi:hypothetical protein